METTYGFVDSDGNTNSITKEGITIFNKAGGVICQLEFNDVENFLFKRVMMLEDRLRDKRKHNLEISEND